MDTIELPQSYSPTAGSPHTINIMDYPSDMIDARTEFAYIKKGQPIEYYSRQSETIISSTLHDMGYDQNMIRFLTEIPKVQQGPPYDNIKVELELIQPR